MFSAGDLVHELLVEPLTGTGAYGPVYGPTIAVPCYYEGRRRLVRDGDGAEVISEGTAYTNLRDDIPAGSRATIHGRKTWALQVTRLDDGGALDHLAIALA